MTDETTRAPDFEAQAREMLRRAVDGGHDGCTPEDCDAVADAVGLLRSAYAAGLDRAAGECERREGMERTASASASRWGRFGVASHRVACAEAAADLAATIRALVPQ